MMGEQIYTHKHDARFAQPTDNRVQLDFIEGKETASAREVLSLSRFPRLRQLLTEERRERERATAKKIKTMMMIILIDRSILSLSLLSLSCSIARQSVPLDSFMLALG